MPSKTLIRFRNAFATLSAAVRAANAVDSGRRPRQSDLKTLEIDPSVFNKIGL